MRYRKIEVDEEVYAYLQKKAKRAEDDFNNVLRRELLGAADVRDGTEAVEVTEKLEMPRDIPRELKQVLELVESVRFGRQSRWEATQSVAQNSGVTYEALIDICCDGMGLTLSQFDRLLDKDSHEKLKAALKGKYARHSESIDAFLAALALEESRHGEARRKYSIMDLAGLGKGLWEGVDAQEFVNQERDSWNG